MKVLKLKRPGSTYFDMTNGRDVSLMLRFSFPLIIANLFQQLYSFTDAAIIGNYVGVNGFAAVSCASWIIWLINAASRDSANAFCIAASIRVGQKDNEGFRRIVANAVLADLALCAVIVPTLLIGMNTILRLMNVPETIFLQAKTYLTIITLTMPFGMTFHLTTALLRATGNSDITFLAMSVSTVVNIVLDLLFVVVFRWSVAGAAIATMIAQALAMALALFEAGKNPQFRLKRSELRPDAKLLREVTGLWAPMMVNSLVISLGGLYVQKVVNAIGAYFTAGLEASGVIFSLLEAIIMAIQTGSNVFVGQNLGAKQPGRIYRGLHRIILLATALTAALIGIVWLTADQLIAFFLSSEDAALFTLAHAAGVKATKVMITGMLIMTPMYFYRSTLQTMGHQNYAMYAGFLQMLTRIATVVLLPGLLGEYAYYLPTVLAWTVTLPVVVPPYYHFIRKLCREEREAAPQIKEECPAG